MHIALGVRADGMKEVLGLWIEQNEGAKFWLRVMNELRHRAVEDILPTAVDRLKGFPEALVHSCIVRLLRHSLDFIAWKDCKSVATALKDIYRAVYAETGKTVLATLAESPWIRNYAAIVQSWKEVILFGDRFVRATV